MVAKYFNFCITLVAQKDLHGFEQIFNYYNKRVQFAALKNVEKLDVANNALGSVFAYIARTAKNMKPVKDPNLFMYTLADKISKNYTPIGEVKPLKYDSTAEGEFVEMFLKMTKDEQEIFLLVFVFKLSEKAVADYLNKPIKELQERIDDIMTKYEELLQMFNL